MATVAAPSTPSDHTATELPAKGRIGLVVLGSITSGLALGLVLVLVLVAGAPEHEITGAALVALGSGFGLLAVGARRFTDQPQPWAFGPSVASTLAGLSLWALSPSEHTLALAGWVWPVLLAALVAWSVRGARRTLRSRSRVTVLYPALFVLGLVAAGGAIETVAETTSSNPTLGGRTYLINGHRLYLNCVGKGEPTVVLFSGLGERTRNWARVQRMVSSSTRVCTYDRAGEGSSGGTDAGQDGRQLTSDLHALLRAAHVPGPYVLAGHSVGGTYALLYAAHYPEQVAGLALIDSATPYQFDLPDYPSFYAMWRRGSALLPTLARAGLARVASGTSPAGSPRELRADRAEFLQLPRIFDEAKAVSDLGGRPLAVITAGLEAQRGWSAAQERLAKLSSQSTQLTVAGGSHTALLEDRTYSSITARAITQVTRLARSPKRQAK